MAKVLIHVPAMIAWLTEGDRLKELLQEFTAMFPQYQDDWVQFSGWLYLKVTQDPDLRALVTPGESAPSEPPDLEDDTDEDDEDDED